MPNPNIEDDLHEILTRAGNGMDLDKLAAYGKEPPPPLPTVSPQLGSVPPTAHPAANDLLTKTCEVVDRAHDFAIEEIDGMINMLHNLKAGLELKKSTARASLHDLINSIGHSSTTLQELKDKMRGLEKRHLQ